MKPTIILMGIVLSSVAVWSQPPRSEAPVDLCALLKTPASLNEKNVTIQGQIRHFRTRPSGVPIIHGVPITGSLGISSPACDTTGAVWVEFAEDDAIANNADIKRLKSLLNARRAFTPSGDSCGSECSYYDVSAKVSGRFLVRGDYCGKQACAFYLLIEQASDIAIARTKVPFGGRYRCEIDEWKPNAVEWATLNRAVPESTDVEAKRQIFYSKIAAHWHDAPVTEAGLYGGREDEWISPDLMRGYEASYMPLTNNPFVGRVTRHSCVPLSPHAVSSEPPGEIRCEQLSSGKTSSGTSTLLESSAREFARTAFANWGKFIPALRNYTCTDTETRDETLEKAQDGQCSFTTDDDLVSVLVKMSRTQRILTEPKPWSQVPWKINWLDASICYVSK